MKTSNLNQIGSIHIMAIFLLTGLSFFFTSSILQSRILVNKSKNRLEAYLCFKNLHREQQSLIKNMNRLNRGILIADKVHWVTVFFPALATLNLSSKGIENALMALQETLHIKYILNLNRLKLFQCRSFASTQSSPYLYRIKLKRHRNKTTILKSQKWKNTLLTKNFILQGDYKLKNNISLSAKSQFKEYSLKEALLSKQFAGSVFLD